MPVDDDAQAGVTYLNELRRSFGLAEVVLDPEMSFGATLHARYLTTNAGRPEIAGLRGHHEDPALPGVTREGTDAGEHGVIDYTSATAPGAIDVWLSTFYHRIPLLHPDVRRIGVGHSGTVHVLSVEVLPSGHDAPVAYPYDHQRAVPMLYARGEVPDPRPQAWFGTGWAAAVEMRSGYPVTVTFDRHEDITDVRASLSDDTGPVEAVVSSPQAPATGFPQGNVVTLLPRRALAPGTTYHASVAYRASGVPRELAWEFTTAPARAFDPAAPAPAPGSALAVAGLVESAWPTQLCDDEAHTRCKERIQLELARASPTDMVIEIDVFDAGRDRSKLLGLRGRGIQISGLIDSAIPGKITLAVEDAHLLVVTDDHLPVIAADAVPADVSGFAWITGTITTTSGSAGGPVFAQLGKTAPVFVELSGELWIALKGKLAGHRVRVRDRVQKGQPYASASFIYAADAGQIEVIAEPRR